MVRAMILALAVITAQAADPAWERLQELQGDWVGEGSGQPGEATGGFSFTSDLEKSVLIRRNHAQYPATKDRPAFRHDDLMVIYRTPEGLVRADYWDNEGHIIHYSVAAAAKEIVMTSDPQNAAPRFRFTYITQEDGSLKLRFEIAPPGKPSDFKLYLEAAARRKARM